MAAGGLFNHAYIAVDFFFCISGFVLTSAYQKRLANKQLSPWGFMALRLVRLYPLIALGTGLGTGLYCYSAVRTTGGVSPEQLINAALGILVLPSPYGQTGLFPINGPEWSLFFELAVNVLFCLTATMLTRGRLLITVLVSFLWLALESSQSGFALLGITAETFIGGIPRVIFSFFLGSLLYHTHTHTHGTGVNFSRLVYASGFGATHPSRGAGRRRMGL